MGFGFKTGCKQWEVQEHLTQGCSEQQEHEDLSGECKRTRLGEGGGAGAGAAGEGRGSVQRDELQGVLRAAAAEQA